ncbi:MAG: Sucrose-6-phosphate hydrolase [Candidatus Erwinia impunctatus]|nr:Sucrose-6-phosphate hydrolase [Culicoides impunctatus]
MKFTLAAAELELAQRMKTVGKRWYPRFHLAGRAGWINDPNGLIFHDGWYHAFYQHHPYGTAWGPMHWGHARSKDMLHWEQLPVALTPEGAEDKNGCFSGSAVIYDGKMALIYTGNKFEGDSTSDDDLYQVQCLATSNDGIHFDRHGIIIDTPPGVHHFRDPKVWQEGDRWYMVVGVSKAGVGHIHLYSSSDLKEWQDEGILAAAPDSQMGFMWECPDFFRLGDKYVLVFSPQGLARDGYDYVNLYQSGYIIGSWSPGKPFQQETPFIEMDLGDSFYAPQTFLAEDGRRILIGWMVMWDSYLPESRDGWAGQLTLPRELSLNDRQDRLVQRPIRELSSLYQNSHHHHYTLKNQQTVVCSMCQHEDIVVRLSTQAAAEEYGLSLGEGLRVYIDSQAKRVVVERNYAEYGLVGKRSVPLPDSEHTELRLIIDNSSLELFVNQGESVVSTRFYPDESISAHELRAFAWGGTAQLDIERKELVIT